MMTDHSALLKQHAKAMHLARPNLTNSRGQTIELAAALFTTAPSWNHFSAEPAPLLIPDTLNDFFMSVVAKGNYIN